MLESSGDITPPAEVATELTEAASFALADEATLRLLHYRTCTELAVSGGRVSVETWEYEITGGKTLEETRRTCPKRVRLKGEAVIAGVVLRGGATRVLPARPSFYLVGTDATNVRTIVFENADTPAQTFAHDGRRFDYPRDGAPLPAAPLWTAVFKDAGGNAIGGFSFTVPEASRQADASDGTIIVEVVRTEP